MPQTGSIAGGFLDGHATEANFFNRGAILARQVTDLVSDKGTDCLRNVRLVADRCFSGERLMGTCTRGSPPKVICDRIPENAIEARDCALVVTNIGTVFHSLKVRGLEDALGRCPVFNRADRKLRSFAW